MTEEDPGGDAYATVSACTHRWKSVDAGRVCCSRCRVVLTGSLAANPPKRGMDWNRAVMLPVVQRWVRRSYKSVAAGGERRR